MSGIPQCMMPAPSTIIMYTLGYSGIITTYLDPYNFGGCVLFPPYTFKTKYVTNIP